MKKTTIEKNKKFLLDAKEIMDGVPFAELGRKQKQQIFDAFIDADIDYATDGDSDGVYLYSKSDDFQITFMSYADDFGLGCIRDRLDDLYFNDDIDEVYSIDKAISMLDAIKPDDVPLALLNTSIVTEDGDYSLHTITLDKARELVQEYGGQLDSAIGHDATAKVMTDLLGVNVPVNRQMFSQQVGQQALVFKLHGRLPEGRILTVDEIEAIGFDFKLLERLD